MTYPNNGYQSPQNGFGGYGAQGGGQQANPFAQPQGGNQPVPFHGQQQFAGQNYPMQQGYAVPTQQKSWIAALLLCFFLGGFGAHNFYTLRTGRAIGQLALGFLGGLTVWMVGLGLVFLSALALWVFIEFIFIIAGAGGYDRDAHGVPLQK